MQSLRSAFVEKTQHSAPIRTYHARLGPRPLSRIVRLVDVFRDLVQAPEIPNLPTHVKIAYLNMMSQAGVSFVEPTAFVNTTLIPKMTDAGEVMKGLRLVNGTKSLVLVPNMKYFRQAIEYKPDGIELFTSASEKFCQKNINCSISESLERFRPVITEAQSHNLLIRIYLSCCWGCPFEGAVVFEKTKALASALYEMGGKNVMIVLSDTIGNATRDEVIGLIGQVAEVVPLRALALHLHGISPRVLENVVAGIYAGVHIIDGSLGKGGGCPKAKEAATIAPNTQLDELIPHLQKLSIDTNVDSKLLKNAKNFLEQAMLVPEKSDKQQLIRSLNEA